MISIGETDDRAEIGEVILCEGEMVILLDITLYRAKVETENGDTHWVNRDTLSQI